MPSDVRFSEVNRKLRAHGWNLDRISGSHHIFTGEGRPLVSIPVHKGKVKAVYATKIDQIIAGLSETPRD